MISPGRSWREFPQRYRLEAAKCEACEKIHYPPRVVCSKCGGSTFENITLPREGKVVTFTIVRVPPAGFTEQTPLPIAIVEVMDGVRIMVQIGDLEDPSDLEIGMPVRLEFRRISWDGEAGLIFYGHKAVRA
jgi:scaffold protein (connect acetoacetyl-CoA thiolase and HMG-CoA synthase)